MFHNETFFIESPIAMPNKDFEEDDFSRIFRIEQNENEDNISFDNLYFLRRLNSNDSSNNGKFIENKIEMEKQDDNSILDDYELYYTKFTNIKENNEINPKIEDNSFPFENNLTNEEKLIYSYIEDEFMIIIENQEPSQKLEKDKILKVAKDLKKQKYLECKKKIHVNQNQSNFAPKTYQRGKNNKTQEDINNKVFPFTPGNGLIPIT